jgi:hypothetical protein
MTTTEVSTLSERELDEAIQIALGFTKTHNSFVCARIGGLSVMAHRDVPHYSTSIDALGEVEARLREAGFTLNVQVWPTGAHADWSMELPPKRTQSDATFINLASYMSGPNVSTEARARAEAALSALQALNSPTTEIAND